MPLDPQISLQGRGVDIKPIDPLATLLQVSQIKNLQSQDQLRQLQTAQLGATLGQYRDIQAPGGPLAQLSALSQGPQSPGTPPAGMVPGAQLGGLPPGGGAITQGPMAAPGVSSLGAGGIAPLYNQLSPATQAVYPGGPPPDAGQPQAPPQSAPQPAPQEQLEAARQLPPDIGDGTRSAKKAAILQDMLLKYPLVAPHVVTPFIAVDKQLLEQRKGELDFQKTTMDLLSQGIASVMDQPKAVQPQAYAQWRQLVITRNIPGAAQQFPEQFDPQLMQAYATAAQTKQERARLDLDRLGKEIEIYGKHTDRLSQEADVYGKETERLKLSKIAIHEGATTNTPYFEYGAVGQAIGQAPGAPPGTIGGLPASAPSKAAMQPLQAAEGKQLEALTTAGETGRSVHQTLNEVERLIGEGVYEQSPTLSAALWTYKQGGKGGVLPGYDEATLDRTQRVRELGAQLKLAQGRLGSGVSDTEGSTYGRAAGDFESGATFGKMRESITSMRKIADQAISNANSAKTGMRTGAGIPPIEGQATGGTPPPAGARNTAVTSAQVSALATRYGLPEAEIRQRLQAAGKQVQ